MGTLLRCISVLANSFDFGLLGEQSSQKFVIPCLGRRQTTEQALSLVEKSVSIQTNTHTQKPTVNDISTVHAYWHVWNVNNNNYNISTLCSTTVPDSEYRSKRCYQQSDL